MARVYGLFDSIVVVEHLVLLQHRLHSAGKAKATEAIVEDLVRLERGRGVVRYLHTRGVSVKNAVSTQHGMALRAV